VILPLNPTQRAIRGKLVHLTGQCPLCGNQVQRGLRHG
jgi:hypothetical protein